jgi:TrmH RNA methyltransferase
MRNRFTKELAVCGLHSVEAVAEYSPEKVNRLFLREDRMPQFRGLCHSLAERKRAYKICEDEELEKICKTGAHQGVVAMIYEPEVPGVSKEDVDAWAERDEVFLLLYNVINGHNVGAIVRSAAFFGVKDVILCDDEPEAVGLPLLSTAAYCTAEGGMEHVRVHGMTDAAGFLRYTQGKITSIATSLRTRTRLEYLAADLKEKHCAKLLLLGNEEKGLPESLQKLCTYNVRIPGTGLVESLNVSAACAVFLHALCTP